MTPGSALSPSLILFLSLPLFLFLSISAHLDVQLLFATWPLSLLPLRFVGSWSPLLLPSFLSALQPARSRCRNYCQYSGLTWRDTLGPCARGQASGLAEITVGRRLAEERITCTRAGAFRARILACTRARMRPFPRQFALIDNFAVFNFEGYPITSMIDS